MNMTDEETIKCSCCGSEGTWDIGLFETGASLYSCEECGQSYVCTDCHYKEAGDMDAEILCKKCREENDEVT